MLSYLLYIMKNMQISGVFLLTYSLGETSVNVKNKRKHKISVNVKNKRKIQ